MAERILIVKVRRTSATAAELYGSRHKYADLRLFDLGELAAVGIDPAGLAIGEEAPARFWAIYELSTKTNTKGNPYKDVIGLEPWGTSATTTSAAVGDPAILAELRAIRALLTVIAEAQGLQVPAPVDQDHNGDQDSNELERAFPRYGDGQGFPPGFPANLAPLKLRGDRAGHLGTSPHKSPGPPRYTR